MAVGGAIGAALDVASLADASVETPALTLPGGDCFVPFPAGPHIETKIFQPSRTAIVQQLEKRPRQARKIFFPPSPQKRSMAM